MQRVCQYDAILNRSEDEVLVNVAVVVGLKTNRLVTLCVSFRWGEGLSLEDSSDSGIEFWELPMVSP